MTVTVHPSAVVHPTACLSDGVVIGPFCHVGEGVELGPGTELVGHATVLGPCRLGARNRVHPQATLGAPPQDRSYAGETTRLVIGDDNVFRENVTVHRGTEKGGGVTRIGSFCLFMVGCHVAHDCTVGDAVTFANQTTLGGHVVVEEGVVTGGHVAVAPFHRLGELAFAAGGAMIERPVPPFVIVAGDRARVRGVNRVGLLRAGVPEAEIQLLERAYLALWGSRVPLLVAVQGLSAALHENPRVARWVRFIEKTAR
jgi:UDP-N-acetylglucosamine acyltransferase